MPSKENQENNDSTVYSFSQYNETRYSVNAEGKFEAHEWSYYKDYHPAKYDISYEKLGYTWVIKFKEEKILLISGCVDENVVKETMTSISKTTTIKVKEETEIEK